MRCNDSQDELYYELHKLDLTFEELGMIEAGIEDYELLGSSGPNQPEQSLRWDTVTSLQTDM